MTIEKTSNGFYPELSSFNFYEGDSILCIFLSEDLTLNFTITNNKLMKLNGELNVFTITKENFEVYKLFKELIDDFEKISPICKLSKELLINFNDYKNGIYSESDKYYNKNFKFETFEEPDVYKDRCITWHSDSSYYSTINTLQIKETNEGIKLTIKTSKQRDLFLGRTVRITNSYSLQNPYGFLFMSFYYKLQNINPNYNQTDLLKV